MRLYLVTLPFVESIGAVRTDMAVEFSSLGTVGNRLWQTDWIDSGTWRHQAVHVLDNTCAATRPLYCNRISSHYLPDKINTQLWQLCPVKAAITALTRCNLTWNSFLSDSHIYFSSVLFFSFYFLHWLARFRIRWHKALSSTVSSLFF